MTKKIWTDDFPEEPEHFKDIAGRPDAAKWLAAVEEELASLKKHYTWDVVDEVPPGKTIVSTRYVFRLKKDAEGKILRYKARFCARGFTQVFGMDYDEVYAPVAKRSSIRMLLSKQ
jgi:hypothetical protein